ncbi:P-loop containing nucleoside triphosphate hydrolase protein [Schizophyllum amplum]|uniref:P-loop containing nucleoside triphosphate hydrolase protein n=1 Tax=Schizophyllum amplum TaxID=97359 RepID=A0A550BZN9_9AGAR|nr:P-loop containing nucleoside triphosphate hydrolase protein [Auriculariopsis ampla]
MLSLSENDSGTAPSSGRQMLDHVNRLHSTGNLPQIAVVGTQSVGKTSLIESITGISLPRESGTCTRCPIECRLAHSDSSWSCVVSLRINENGQSRNVPFGDIILDPEEVEKRVRKAQKAILNPSQPISDFLHEDADLQIVNEERFSSNTICLQITGPSLTDLSFCDLPGLIASVSMDGDSQDIKLVDDLVRSYIMKPSCIILLAVSCETDFENQKAHQLVHEVDPDRSRTIGVLTKPDRIQKLEEGQWLRLLRNEKEQLAYGWYVVKLPTSADMSAGITWEEARAEETKFFDDTYPWPDENFTHLGTPNLIVQLEAVLSELIMTRLPEIQKELNELIARTQERLRTIPPPPPENPFFEITHKLGAFSNEVEACVDGKKTVEGEAALQQKIRPRFLAFKGCILKTAPRFMPWQHSEASGHTLKAPEFAHFEDGGESFVVNPTTVFSFNASTQKVDRIARLEALQQRNRELPGMTSFEVHKKYIKEFVDAWGDPTRELVKDVADDVGRLMRKLVDLRFHGPLAVRVKSSMQDIVKRRYTESLDALNELLARAQTPQTLLEAHYTEPDPALAFAAPAPRPTSPSTPPALVATPAFPQTSNSGFSFGKPASTPGTAPVVGVPGLTPPVEKSGGFGGFAPSGGFGASASSAFKVAPMSPGPFGGAAAPAPAVPEPAPSVLSAELSTALGIMAHVRAYFEIAYKRYLDNVHEIVDYKLVRGVARDLHAAMNKGLGIDGPDAQKVCASLTIESEGVRARREELQKKLERLEAASHGLTVYH